MVSDHLLPTDQLFEGVNLHSGLTLILQNHLTHQEEWGLQLSLRKNGTSLAQTKMQICTFCVSIFAAKQRPSQIQLTEVKTREPLQSDI